MLYTWMKQMNTNLKKYVSTFRMIENDLFFFDSDI